MEQFDKSALKIKDYLRYCDDFCFFHNDKRGLHEVADALRDFCGERLRLTLSKCDLFPVSRGVDFLGYRHFPDYVLLRKSTAKRVIRRLRALPGLLADGMITPERFRGQVASAWGWVRWANTHHLALHTHIQDLMEQARHVETLQRLCQNAESA